MPEAVIETAIGLFFVFLLMSMVSSQIVEWIASYGHWRAKELENSIRGLLFDPVVTSKLDSQALALSDKLFEHPLIASLAMRGGKPSYIPAGKFTLALFDVILTAGTDTSSLGRARLGLEQVKNHLLTSLPVTAGPELMKLLNDIQALIDDAHTAGQIDETIAGLALPPRLNTELNGFLKSYDISPQTFNALIQAVTTDSNLQLAQLRAGISQLAKLRPELSQLITSLFTGLDAYIAKGEPQLAAARRNVENWFDESMSRLGGHYKRRIHLWLALIGFCLAFILNVDAINIATTLWRDPTLRQNVVQQAEKYQMTQTTDGKQITTSGEAGQAINDLNATLSQDLRLPIGWAIQIYPLKSGEACAWLPVRPGDVWGLPTAEGCKQMVDTVPNPNSNPWGKLAGFLVMAAAISQGAPFWFDLLSKLINIRGAGDVPATSRENRQQAQ